MQTLQRVNLNLEDGKSVEVYPAVWFSSLDSWVSAVIHEGFGHKHINKPDTDTPYNVLNLARKCAQEMKGKELAFFNEDENGQSDGTHMVGPIESASLMILKDYIKAVKGLGGVRSLGYQVLHSPALVDTQLGIQMQRYIGEPKTENGYYICSIAHNGIWMDHDVSVPQGGGHYSIAEGHGLPAIDSRFGTYSMEFNTRPPKDFMGDHLRAVICSPGAMDMTCGLHQSLEGQLALGNYIIPVMIKGPRAPGKTE